jgi:hypothetical protein
LKKILIQTGKQFDTAWEEYEIEFDDDMYFEMEEEFVEFEDVGMPEFEEFETVMMPEIRLKTCTWRNLKSSRNSRTPGRWNQR